MSCSTTEQLNDACFDRPRWQQLAELPDDLTEDLTEMMHEVFGDYMLDIAQDIVSGKRIGDDTLKRINGYLYNRIDGWLDRHEQEIFDHFSESHQ